MSYPLFRRSTVSISTNGDNTVIAGVAGQPINVYKIFLSMAGAVNLTMKSGTTVIGGPYIFTANGSSMTMYYDGDPHWIAAFGQDFVINLSAGVACTGQIFYNLG